MSTLRANSSLVELQAYVAAIEIERGFANETALQKCLLLGEEVGELFKAVRQSAGIAVDQASTVGSVADELADVLIFVLAIANRFQIDVDAAVRGKEDRNRERVWT